MYIGVDASCWINQRGYGRHARALFTHLIHLDVDNQYELIIDSPDDFGKLSQNARWRHVPVKVPGVYAARADSARSLSALIKMSAALSDTNYDLLIFPTVYTFVPVISRSKMIVFIHDVIPESYPGMTVSNYRSRLFWRVKSRLAIFQADILLTVSEYSRKGIAEYYRINPNKIHVIGEAPDAVFRRIEEIKIPPDLEKLGITPDRRMIIFVGGFGPHKNIFCLLRAFQELIMDPEYKDLLLVLVGENRAEMFTTEFGDLNQYIERHIANSAIFTGFLEDNHLVQLLNCASVLVLPSWIEGFGLPAVEAAACGCPVIATQNSPLPNILGESALFFDPGDTDQLAAQLKTVLSSRDLRQRMSEGGLKAVKKLSWESAARNLLEEIHMVTGSEEAD